MYFIFVGVLFSDMGSGHIKQGDSFLQDTVRTESHN